jgi:argininosuccinate lyase
LTGGIYRSRLARDIDSRSRRFISSLEADSELLQYEIDSSLAHVVMLKEQGWVSAGEAARIAEALRKTAKAGVPTEGFEDIHEYVETEVTRLASRKIGGRLHTARSRNDQVATITRMMCRDRLLQLMGTTGALVETLLELSRRYSSTPMLAYTHLRQAQLQTLGHHLQSYAEPLIRDIERMSDCLDRTDECPLGASAIAGSTLRVDRRRTSELLGFASVMTNCEDAVESRDYAVEAVFVQALLAVDLSRMAEDLIIWSTTEFAYFELPDSMASPSSAMPHKKNADVLEMVRADSALQIAELVQMLATLKGLASGYNRDLQNIKDTLARSFKTTEGALSTLERCLKGGSFNTIEMRRKAEESDVFALPMAEWLVKKRGLPFREAHRVAGKASSVLTSKKKRFLDLSHKEMARLLLQADHSLRLTDPGCRELRSYLRLEAILNETTTYGGPSGAQVRANYRSLRRKLEGLEKETEDRRRRVSEAKHALGAAVSTLS